MLHRVRWEVRFLLLLVLTPALVWVYLDVRLSWEIDRELQRIRAEGYPVTPDEIKLKSVPDDQNAATLYVRGPEGTGACAGAQQVAPPFACFRGEAWTISDACIAVMTEDSASRLLAVLREPAVARAVDAIVEASRRPACVFPLAARDAWWCDTAEFDVLRDGSRLLLARSLLAQWEGDGSTALGDCATILRMARQATAQPSTRAQYTAYELYGRAFAGLRPLISRHRLSAVQRQELRSVLQDIDLCADLHAALIRERAVYWDWVRQADRVLLYSASNGVTFDLSPWPPLYDLRTALAFPDGLRERAYFTQLGRPMHSADLLHYLMIQRRVTELSQLPPPQAVAALAPVHEECVKASERGQFGTALGTGWGAEAVAAMAQTSADIRACLIVLELQEYHSQHGNYPTRLAELSEADGAHSLEDPCTGRPFSYLKHGNGCIVYHGAPPLPPGGAPPAIRLLPGTTIPADSAWACDYDGPLRVPDGPDE